MTLSNMSRNLGNGSDIHLFYDKWSSETSTLISQLDPMQMPIHIKHWRVSNIIENGKWVIKDQFLLPVWDVIKNLEIQNSDTLDAW